MEESLPEASMGEAKLPEELIFCILSWLPVKSLARFRSVCKTCNSFISSPVFIAQHISATASLSHSLLTLSKIDDDPVYDLYYPPFDAENCSRRLDTPPNPEGYDSLLVCVVHGVVCMFGRVSSEKSVILWNPIIGKHISFPIAEDLTVKGFGYDSVTKQLKMLASRSNQDFGVISDRDRQWRKLDDVHRDHLGASKVVFYEHQYYQGCIYSLRCYERWFLVVFDCAKEEFRTMDLPDELTKCNSSMGLGCGPDSEQLIVTHCGAGFSLYLIKEPSKEEPEIDIWGMKYGEEATSWVKVFALSLQFLPLQFSAVDVRVLLVYQIILPWFGCDVIGKTVKRIFKRTNLVLRAKFFQESLLLLDA